ncbi:MAG: hypothetical protein NTY53_15875 [Kiritimatiellaeota bacterium]|nr:hypothetical protein [Kiritimatiellota bacterium]
MFNHFIRFILQQRLLVCLATGVLAVAGTLAWKPTPSARSRLTPSPT